MCVTHTHRDKILGYFFWMPLLALHVSVCVCVCLGFPAPAVKLPESQTRLVIPAVNILGGNSRLLLLTHSPETRLLYGACVRDPRGLRRGGGALNGNRSVCGFQSRRQCSMMGCCECLLLCFCVLERERVQNGTLWLRFIKDRRAGRQTTAPPKARRKRNVKQGRGSG